MDDLREWFLARVEVQPSGCWRWVGDYDADGYGLARLPDRTVKAHRLSCELHHGDPSGLVVLHGCDTPACVNPAHLSLGTQKQNVADRIQKNRSASGEANGRAKLNPPKVRLIHRLLEQGSLSKTEIAGLFGIERKVVSKIEAGINWSQITGR